MSKNFLPFFLIFLTFVSIYNGTSNENNFTPDNPANKSQSFTDTIKWNVSIVVSISKENNNYTFSVKGDLSLDRSVTFKSLASPPGNFRLENSDSKWYWCWCPPQLLKFNVTYQSTPFGMSVTANSNIFPKSDNYTFHIYQLALNHDFNFTQSVIVNGSDYLFSGFNNSYSGYSSDLNIYTTSLSSTTTGSSSIDITSSAYSIGTTTSRTSSISSISVPLDSNWSLMIPALITLFFIRKKKILGD